jgi:hypothetical protein
VETVKVGCVVKQVGGGGRDGQPVSIEDYMLIMCKSKDTCVGLRSLYLSHPLCTCPSLFQVISSYTFSSFRLTGRSV